MSFRSHQPSLTDRRVAGICVTKARRFEIRPSLLGAGSAEGTDVEPVTLGQSLGDAGLDLRGEARKNGDRRGGKGGNRDHGKSLEHDGVPCRLDVRPFRPGVLCRFPMRPVYPALVSERLHRRAIQVSSRRRFVSWLSGA
uniref:Uncharacterized protein n=1 Tax=Rhodopseudomonas palustris (strain ATCC BAA-98 / CGA009) TaxID=258594 RepID=Q6N6L5_RHOPA|nr:hypothetical protein RPA2600 [Rhodopseudomonas palustris CGA009]